MDIDIHNRWASKKRIIFLKNRQWRKRQYRRIFYLSIKKLASRFAGHYSLHLK